MNRVTVRILLLDIETSPYIAEVFELRNVFIRPEQIVEHSRMICFAAKWYGAKRTEFRSEFHDGHEAMIKRLWDLLDEADVVVHYYGGSFDIPRANQEFLLAGLGPPSPYQQLDLLKTSRRFKMASHKLGAVLERVGLVGKVKHEGQSLWHACMQGDPRAWAKMRRYNIRDVTGLEELYDLFGPWIIGHPNHGAYKGLVCCPRCGSTDLQRRGFAYKQTRKYQRFQCLGCGSWPTSTKAESQAASLSLVA